MHAEDCMCLLQDFESSVWDQLAIAQFTPQSSGGERETGAAEGSSKDRSKCSRHYHSKGSFVPCHTQSHLKNRTVTLDMERVCTKEKDKDSKKQRAFIYWNGKKRSVHASDVGGVNYFTSSQVSTVQPASQKNAAVSLAKKIEVGLLQGVILNATPVHHGFA